MRILAACRFSRHDNVSFPCQTVYARIVVDPGHGPPSSTRSARGPADSGIRDQSLLVGASFGQYRVVAPLGAGSMGEVWRAYDTRLGREVALKMLPEELAEDPERMARFTREAKVLASLNHPNIAILFGLEHLPLTAATQDAGAASSSSGASGPENGRPVHLLVMELVEGEGLDEIIARGPADSRRRDGDRPADGRRAGGGPRARHRPPRPQAREHQGPPRRNRQDPRLRPGHHPDRGAGSTTLNPSTRP